MGVMGLPAPETAPVGLMRRSERKPLLSFGSGRPPGSHEALPASGPPRCDKCHVAPAQFEVVIDSTLLRFLYFCGHHMKKVWADLTARGYQIRRL